VIVNKDHPDMLSFAVNHVNFGIIAIGVFKLRS